MVIKKSVETQDLNMNLLVNNLLKQLEAKDHQIELLNQTIANLTETINELKRKIFGISSEKSSNLPCINGQLSLFDQLGIDEPIQEPELVRNFFNFTPLSQFCEEPESRRVIYHLLFNY